LWSCLPLGVPEIRRGVVDETAPHDDVGLVILDRLPCPQDTFAAEAAALGDPLRALVVEMSDELNPHDSIVSKGPLSDEIERLDRDPTASNSTIKPVERLGSMRGDVELNADLTNAVVRRWHGHRKASQTARPPLKPAFDPLPGLIHSHRLRHHREPGYVGIPAGLGNSGRITDPERTQSGLNSGEGRIGRHHITHWDSVADTENSRPGFRSRQQYRRSRMLRLLGLVGQLAHSRVRVARWIPDGVLDLDELLGVSLAIDADEDLACLIA
jgi:hypothetical protein